MSRAKDEEESNIFFSAFKILLIAVPAIIGLALVTKYFLQGPKYCPHTLSAINKSIIDQSSSCEEFRRDDDMYQLCNDYKFCKECPSRGICQDGKFVGCETGYVKEGNTCIENYEV